MTSGLPWLTCDCVLSSRLLRDGGCRGLHFCLLVPGQQYLAAGRGIPWWWSAPRYSQQVPVPPSTSTGPQVPEHQHRATSLGAITPYLGTYLPNRYPIIAPTGTKHLLQWGGFLGPGSHLQGSIPALPPPDLPLLCCGCTTRRHEMPSNKLTSHLQSYMAVG